jgi:hypothetical protein
MWALAFSAAGQLEENGSAMTFQRIRRTVLTAMFLTGSAAIAIAQTGTGGDTTSKPGTAAGSRGSGGGTGTPSAVDTTGMGGSRPGCGPSPGGSPVASAERPPGSIAGGAQAPRITSDPTAATSESTETGLGTDAVTPKNPKTGKLGDC